MRQGPGEGQVVVEKVLRFDDQAYPMTCRLGARGPQSLQGMNEPDPIGGGLETRV